MDENDPGPAPDEAFDVEPADFGELTNFGVSTEQIVANLRAAELESPPFPEGPQ